MAKPDEGKESARGFEGLGDLLGDASAPAPEVTEAPSRTSQPETTAPPSARPRAEQESTGQQEAPTPPPPNVPTSSGGLPWGWIAAGVVGLLVVIGNIAEKKSPSVSAVPATAYESAPAMAQESAPTPIPQWVEDPPPVGRDRVLTREQLRYCLSEKVRVEAMEQAVNQSNSAHISTFNVYVDDYNSRCGRFQYYENMFPSVQSEVNAQRDRLSTEGMARLPSSTLGYPAEPQGELVPPSDLPTSTMPADAGAGVDLKEAQSPQQEKLAALPSDGLLTGLTLDERESLVLVCAPDRRQYGPAAYDICVSQQLAALERSPRQHDLSGLTADERRVLDKECATAKRTEGPAAFNRCVDREIQQIESSREPPGISGLSSYQRQEVESACSYDRRMNGPDAYSRCISQQLERLTGNAGAN